MFLMRRLTLLRTSSHEFFYSQAARGVHYDADSDQMVAARRCVIGGKWPLKESVLRPVEDITAYVHFLTALMRVSE